MVEPFRVDNREWRRIARRFGLSFIVIFGSKASNRKGFKDDVDIAVMAKGVLRGDVELRLVGEISHTLETDALDVVVLNFSPPLLQYEVSGSGKLLYEEAAGLFDRFKFRALQRWNDNKKFHNLNAVYLKNYLGRKGDAKS